MVRRFLSVVAAALVFAVAPGSALAVDGTVTGTVRGPHDETAAGVTYSFKNKSTGAQFTGTTDSNGTFSQALDSSAQYSFSITPDTSKSGFTYAGSLEIPYVGVPAGQTLNMGTMRLFNKAGEADKDVDGQAMTLPSQCTATPAAGAPVISRVDFIDAAHGSFMYAGRNVGVVIFADKPGYTVMADFSIPENQQPQTTTVAATDNGDGSYTASHTLVNTGTGGGLVMASAMNGSAQTSTGCSAPGPVNLDIRTEKDGGSTAVLGGSDTTNFSTVADFRKLKNFTMHVDGVVKVKFPNEVNMLDASVQNFMKGMFKKMTKGTGIFGLDAKAVLELKNAGAEITFYNVPDYLSTPTILLDGAAAGSAVSGVTYDRSAHTLTFTAAHFSTFTAVPTITFTSPDDKTTTTNEKQTIKGSVNDAAATVTVKVGSTDQGTVTVASDGTFSKEVTLALGDNTVTISASNSIGSAISVSRTITRQALPVTGTSAALVLSLVLGLAAGVGLRLATRSTNA